jgi:hypothetical protein
VRKIPNLITADQDQIEVREIRRIAKWKTRGPSDSLLRADALEGLYAVSKEVPERSAARGTQGVLDLALHVALPPVIQNLRFKSQPRQIIAEAADLPVRSIVDAPVKCENTDFLHFAALGITPRTGGRFNQFGFHGNLAERPDRGKRERVHVR